jgi:hypothetical protein
MLPQNQSFKKLEEDEIVALQRDSSMRDLRTLPSVLEEGAMSQRREAGSLWMEMASPL